MTTPIYSIVLPTLNGAGTLPALLAALSSQRTAEPIEVIAVDSGSADGTVDLLERWGADTIRIRPEQFDHGLSRNLAAARARGTFLVFLVQDALPVDRHFLDALAAPFATQPRLAGTFAHQQPRANATRLARDSVQRWVAAFNQGGTTSFPGGLAEFEALAPLERLRRCVLDNVASCIRRSAWEAHPFKATPIAEDLEWAKDILLHGYSIQFVPEAVVLHSHDRSASYEYARTRALHARLVDLFGLQTIPTLPHLGRAIALSAARHLRCEARDPRQWPRALALAVAWPLGQYVGARHGRAGRPRLRLKPGLV